MNQEEAFLQDIVERPDDGAPRLIYADWLDERGAPGDQARAEFIRLQCALHDLPAADPRRVQLEERERELLQVYEAEWAAPMRELLGTSTSWPRCWQFRRGFIEKVRVTPAEFLAGADDLFRLAPMREVMFADFDADAAEWSSLTQSPWLARLKGIDLSEIGVFLAQPEELSRSPNIAGLTTLRVRWSWLEALTSSPHLSRLADLHLAGSPELSQLDVLAQASFPALRVLDLRDNGLDVQALRRLAAWPVLGQLEILDLTMNRLGAQGAEELVTCKALSRLRVLDLSVNRLGLAGARAVAASANLRQLRALHLRTNGLGDEGAAALARARGLPNLAWLRLSDNQVGPRGVAALAAAPPGRLAGLDLGWNPVGTQGALALSASAALAALTALDLGYGELRDDAARALAKSPHLAALTTLNLSTNRIGDAGARALAESPHLARLTALNLGYNNLGEAGVRSLAESPLFRRLEALNLAGNGIPSEWLAEWRQQFRGHLGG
jgi:uncharacterized protein (TIGR02996 family)